MAMMLSIIRISATKCCSCVLMLSLLFFSHAECARARDFRRSEADCSLKARIYDSMSMSSMAREPNGVPGLEPGHHAIMPTNRMMLPKGPPVPPTAPNPAHNGK
ncbi:hypothetical protein O6H91_05G114800 [Diphasiastrum complanatum]|uniref:Uncharacterized protein n=1 Tax=Diphasiastrum complanatum TaxID=34168 RepID=A0ACC2DSE7_DIPCM|nr:hypothetical protein O6H91_05G114800 [Diphasiastrum complanatum]